MMDHVNSSQEGGWIFADDHDLNASFTSGAENGLQMPMVEIRDREDAHDVEDATALVGPPAFTRVFSGKPDTNSDSALGRNGKDEVTERPHASPIAGRRRGTSSAEAPSCDRGGLDTLTDEWRLTPERDGDEAAEELLFADETQRPQTRKRSRTSSRLKRIDTPKVGTYEVQGWGTDTFTPEEKPQTQHRRRLCDDDDEFDEEMIRAELATMPWHQRTLMTVWYFFRQNHYVIFFLTAVGALAALTAAFMDLLIAKIGEFHHWIASDAVTTDFILQYTIWILFTVVILCLAMAMTRLISVAAIGSGIPEMKAILSGVNLRRYLGFRTLVAKLIGLTLTVGSGLPVGKEGPFVHTASIIANLLAREVPLWHMIRHNGPLKQQMLGAACAAGVAGNFGAPVGGLLFSIEVTSTYYPVRNYWYAAFSSIWAGFLFRLLWNIRNGTPLFNAILQPVDNSLEYSATNWWDLAFSVGVGIMCGLLGGIFVIVVGRTVQWRRELGKTLSFFSNPIPYALLVTVLTGLMTFPGFFGSYMSEGYFSLLTKVFEKWSPPDGDTMSIFKYDLYLSLVIFVLSRYFLTALTITVPVPCGLYMPIIATGAVLGRLIGEVMKAFMSRWQVQMTDPGAYAMITAASLAGGVTHTFSSAVIMFEMTGDLNLMVPILIGVITAVAVSRTISKSVYDQLLMLKNLPFLPDLKQVSYRLVARDIMVPEVPVIPQRVDYRKLVHTMRSSNEDIFPVVRDDEDHTLLGETTRAFLEQLLRKYREVKVGAVIDADEETVQELAEQAKEELSFSAEIAGPSSKRRSCNSVLELFTGPPVQDVKLQDERQQSVSELESLVEHENYLDTLGENIEPSMASLFEGHLYVPFDDSTVHLLPVTPMTQVHLLFITLRLNSAFVTEHGIVIGMITRDTLKRAIEKIHGWW